MNESGWSCASQNGLYVTKEWRKLRAEFINFQPLCQMCLTMKEHTPTEVVDHIIPITEKNWTWEFLNWDNLQSLCHSCHSFKTRRDTTKSERKEIDMNFIINM